MDRLRKVARSAVGLALPAVLLAGCASTEKMTQTVKKAVQMEVAPTPATQVVCFWQRKLTPLPDPTKDGSQTLGLPGQMFLITPDNKPADANGDLAVVVYDETPRAPGAPAMRPEVWHYTKDTLKRLVTNDERFGKSFALYLPWPGHWRDVTTVKIMARYQSPGSPDLYASEIKIALDTSEGGPVWTDVGTGNNPRPTANAMLEGRNTIPDPSKLLSQANLSGQPAQPFTNPGTTPAGGFPPPTYTGLAPAVTPASGVNAPSTHPGTGVVPQPTMSVWPPPPAIPPAGTLPQHDNGPLQPIIIQRPAN